MFRVESLEDKYTPSCQTRLSAGYDVKARLEEDVILNPGSIEVIPLGFNVKVNTREMYETFNNNEILEISVRGRSGLAAKHGIHILQNGTGDSDFTGEYKIPVMNSSKVPYTIKDGDRIGQIVFNKVLKGNSDSGLIQLDSVRSGGHGSTGKS
jgi:dUTP pyrophosphatase